jgi:hypothetical protein
MVQHDVVAVNELASEWVQQQTKAFLRRMLQVVVVVGMELGWGHSAPAEAASRGAHHSSGHGGGARSAHAGTTRGAHTGATRGGPGGAAHGGQHGGGHAGTTRAVHHDGGHAGGAYGGHPGGGQAGAPRGGPAGTAHGAHREGGHARAARGAFLPNYHLTHGRPFRHGYNYPGRHHAHWAYTRFDVRYGCTLYYDPELECYYYWCEPDDCYYPVSYCPYQRYAWSTRSEEGDG